MGALSGLVLAGALALLQDRSHPPATEEPVDEVTAALQGLAQLVADPLAPLLELTMEYVWEPSFWGQSGEDQFLRLKPTIPFKLWGIQNVARLTMPYNTVTLNGTHGLGETQLFDLLLFGPDAFEVGVGPVVNFEPSTTSGATLQAGPAVGIRVRQGRWQYGLFSRTFLNAEVANSWLQPILAYCFADWVALSLGDLQITYDWKASRFEQVPLGIRLDFTPKVAGQSLNFYVNPMYNFDPAPGQYRWRILFGFAFLVR